MNNQEESLIPASEVDSESVAASNRRSFIKGTVIAAGTLAASGLAASAEPAIAAEDKQERIAIPSSSLRGIVQVSFSSKTPPKIEDVQSAVAQIAKLNGCVGCGLIGIDLRLKLGDPVQIESRVPVNVTVEKSSS